MCFSSQAGPYLLFFSTFAVFSTFMGLRFCQDGASVSVTRMSNDAADCLSQTPRAEISAISAGVPFSTSSSFTTGSVFTSFHKIEARSPTGSLISLCRSITSPPF